MVRQNPTIEGANSGSFSRNVVIKEPDPRKRLKHRLIGLLLIRQLFMLAVEGEIKLWQVGPAAMEEVEREIAEHIDHPQITVAFAEY